MLVIGKCIKERVLKRVCVLVLVREYVLVLLLERVAERFVFSQSVRYDAEYVCEVVEVVLVFERVIRFYKACGFKYLLKAINLLLSVRLQISFLSILRVPGVVV